MKHGDISNQQGYVIGVRYDGTLVTKQSDSIWRNALDDIFGTSLSYDINSDTLSLMQYIYRRTEHTVVLVVGDKDFNLKSLEDMGEFFPFEKLRIHNESEITMKLLTGDMTYYVDDNDYRRSLVNSEYAVSSKRFNEILRRKGRNR